MDEKLLKKTLEPREVGRVTQQEAPSSGSARSQCHRRVGNWAPEVKTELRSETKFLLPKEPKQEVSIRMPAELQPQTRTLFSFSGGTDLSGAVHQQLLNPVVGGRGKAVGPRCKMQF